MRLRLYGMQLEPILYSDSACNVESTDTQKWTVKRLITGAQSAQICTRRKITNALKFPARDINA